MSLSIGPDLDMQAIVNGGPQFVDRMTKLQDAATKHEQALKDLNLGKSAAAAHVEAHRVLQATNEKCAALLAAANKEADDIKARLASHEAATKGATNDALNAAVTKQAHVDAKLAAAEDALKRAAVVAGEADTKYSTLVSEGQTKADAITQAAIAQANAVKAKADALLKSAQDLMNEAKALEAKLTDKLSRLKSLAAGD